jgi:hypothetical protein
MVRRGERRPAAAITPAHSSGAEAWRVAEEMNEREIKQRASELRDLQRENERGAEEF